ncbi:amidohydrolase family protein [Knoellia koreensis]|jgi:predicted TIM-barrel fold metal-dependent hydrolase|uniref:Amidohydrolase n=1 Tax=Knoellia koreensis TaxID=2730921 RepID=A0A849HCU1_9MICO|nr:amidohydrolase family protein [Knoellia sp. DB2414S]NNM47720.1 amidohydrolase [Knoellia sp. DB2414S]
MTLYRSFEKTTPIIDGHAHMGAFRNFHVPRNDAQGMVERFDEVGIDVACVSHHAGISADFRYGNTQVLEAVQRFPDRLIGFCVVNPNYPDESAAEIERCFASGGFRGFKVHPELHGDYPLDGPGYEEMWRYADANRLPVLSHSYAGGDSLKTFEDVAKRYPGASVMLGHAGLDLGLDNAARLVERTENIYLDMTAMQRHCGAVELLASRVDPARLTWGSDSPFIDPGPILGAVALADIPADVRSAILYDNLARLLRITVRDGRIEDSA